MFTHEQMKRFWKNVDVRPEKNSCWEWKLALDKNGYGKVKIGGKFYISHRAAFEMANKSINPDLFVLHSCDNPKCCNPNHLSQGTHEQNMKEKVARHRAVSVFTPTKLTQEKADAIRKEFLCGSSKLSLGRKFGVSPKTIRSVISRETWNYSQS